MEPSLEPQINNIQEYEPSRFRTIGILLFGFLAFIFFLVLKLPEARIQNYVLAHLRIFSQEHGYLFSAEKLRIGILLGPSVKLYEVTLKSLENEKETVKLPYVKVSPKILSFLTSTPKVAFDLELDEAEVSGVVGASEKSIYADLDIDDLLLEKIPMLSKYSFVTLRGKTNGQVKLDLDLTDPQKSNGKIELEIESLSLPEQSVYGFSLPKLNVKKSTIEISIDQGRYLIRAFDLGSDISQDDLVAKITGEGSIDRIVERSKINGKVVFQLSPKVIQSFPLLESILAPAKTKDGKFGYRLSGYLLSPQVTPEG